MTESMAKVGYSKALADQLNAEEDRLRALEAKLKLQSDTAFRAQVLPHPTVIEGYLHDLVGTLEADADRGREVLARHVGPIVLTPKAESPRRLYLATGAFDMSRVLENESCGGGI